MKEFALIFRMDILTPGAQPSPQQMEIYMQDWMNWINNISQQGQLATGGNHFSPVNAAVLRSNQQTTPGPYASNKESIAGYILILANDLQGAIEIAEKCPILNGPGNSVEVREVATPQNMQDVKRQGN